MKTLVIIDMQKGTIEGTYHGSKLLSDKKWLVNYYSIINNIIDLSKQYQEIIFLVHNKGFRNKTRIEIIPDLKEIAKKAKIIYKYQDDGYSEIKKKITDNVTIVGMNTDACVLHTALSCVDNNINTTVIENACWSVYSAKDNIFNDPFGLGHDEAIEEMRKKGVKIEWAAKKTYQLKLH